MHSFTFIAPRCLNHIPSIGKSLTCCAITVLTSDPPSLFSICTIGCNISCTLDLSLSLALSLYSVLWNCLHCCSTPCEAESVLRPLLHW